MYRRSMDRKLRSSLQKSRVSDTPPSTPKPTKKIRLSANNLTGNQSSDIPNAAHLNESEDLLESEKSDETQDESMQSDDLLQSEKSDENRAESMHSDDFLQSEKSDETRDESIQSDDLLQSEKSDETPDESMQSDDLSVSTSASNAAQSEQSAS